MDLLRASERLFSGEASIEDHHPFNPTGDLVEVGDDSAFIYAFAGVNAFRTGDGLVLVDTGSSFFAQHVFDTVRGWSGDPVTTAVFTHGHIDHVFGLGPFEEEGRGPIRVVAHEGVPARFARYRLTAGYNAHINRRQFGLEDLEWPLDYREPDETYRERHVLEIGGERFELSHAKGETDDHTWVWIPGRKIVCCGDLFIWACPNAGNPAKVQRYPVEWAQALRDMAAVGAEVLLPGHGLPVVGAERIKTVLLESAELLESLIDQTLTLMNEGASLERVLHEVATPPHLLERPYLQPIYDEPVFIVNNIWRLYGGWFDGRPANLKPAPSPDVAAELARLAGGTGRLAERATDLAEEGRLDIACHLVDLAHDADPADPKVDQARSAIYSARAEAERSLMARGVYAWAARQ